MRNTKYLVNAHGQQMSSSELLTALGLKPNSPIPPDLRMEKMIGDGPKRVKVVIERSNGGKHRVKAVCPNCKSLVPAGRLYQHAHSQICEDVKNGTKAYKAA